MRINKAEKAAIIITICVIVLLAGFLLGRNSDTGGFAVITDKGTAFTPNSLSPSEPANTNSPGVTSEPANTNSPGGTSEPALTNSPGVTLVNINTANAETLRLLPGIGAALAERIVEYREQNGSFGVTAEILNVSGIGEKKFDAIKDLITVGS